VLEGVRRGSLASIVADNSVADNRIVCAIRSASAPRMWPFRGGRRAHLANGPLFASESGP
jgi:hypothetical protein